MSQVQRAKTVKKPTHTARDVAKHLIEVYVKRGDTLEQLRAGYMGAFTDYGSAQIGGFMGDKKYSAHFILVKRIGPYKGGVEVENAFKLEEIYNEIKGGQQQLL